MNFEILNFKFLQYLIKLIPNFIIFSYIEKTELTLLVNHKSLYFLMFFCKKHTNILINSIFDIAADYPGKFLRFEVFYNCFSIKYNYRLRIKTILNELFALISLNKLFLSSS
jgi:NADH:ubiquinone oxidoreductase subunit C